MSNVNENARYEDMIGMERPVSRRHPRMSLADRAAQFAPFAALTGYDDEIKETGRLTDERGLMDETVRELLDRKLAYLRDHLKDRPRVTVTYFVPDPHKKGGAYRRKEGVVREIDEVGQRLIFEDGFSVASADVYGMEIEKGRE